MLEVFGVLWCVICRFCFEAFGHQIVALLDSILKTPNSDAQRSRIYVSELQRCASLAKSWTNVWYSTNNGSDYRL